MYFETSNGDCAFAIQVITERYPKGKMFIENASLVDLMTYIPRLEESPNVKGVVVKMETGYYDHVDDFYVDIADFWR